MPAEVLGRMHMASLSPFAVLSGNQVVISRNLNELKANPLGGSDLPMPAKVTPDAYRSDARRQRTPTAPAAAAQRVPQETAAICSTAARKDSLRTPPQPKAQARTKAEFSCHGRGGLARQKVLAAHSPQCASPLMGW